MPLGDDFIDDVINAHEALYKQLLLLATMIKTPAVADFMAEVVREAKRVYLPSLPADAWDQFMANKFRQLDGLAELSESTLKKSGNNAIRILVEADYLNNNRSRQLQPVYLLPETRRWLMVLGREDLKPVMECTL